MQHYKFDSKLSPMEMWRNFFEQKKKEAQVNGNYKISKNKYNSVSYKLVKQYTGIQK